MKTVEGQRAWTNAAFPAGENRLYMQAYMPISTAELASRPACPSILVGTDLKGLSQ